MAKNKTRQKRGTGGLRNKNGKKEGRYRVYRKNGTFIEKSFTRPTETEINDIKASLRLLGVIDNDVIGIDINKHTDEITLQRIATNNKIKLNKDITVNDYVDYWLWNHRRKGEKKQMVKDSTFEDYVEKGGYIKKLLGKATLENGKEITLKVSDLTFEFIEEKLLKYHSEVAHTTAVQIRNHVYNMMKYAKKDGVIEVNPFQDEEINFPEPLPKEKKKIIKEKDVKKVMKHCLKLWFVDVLLQLITGARGGEIRGLKWADINEKECKINFNQGYSSVKQFKLDENNHIISLGRKRRYSSLKTKTSKRTIIVETEFMKILMVHKELQKMLAKRLEITFKETDPVFTTSTYTALGRNDINDKVKKIVKELKIEDWDKITSHCLRHGFCYAGLLNDVPVEYMQLLLGHANIATTLKWYAQFDQGKIDSYAKKVNANRINMLKEISNQNRVIV